MAVNIHNKSVTQRKVKVTRSFERTAWLFMRLSGIALLFLAVSHVFLQLIINSVHDLNLGVVADNWSNSIRRFSEWLLLIFSLSHGLGLRNVLEDYIHSDGTMKIIRYGFLAFFIVTILFVTSAIVLFDVEAVRGIQAMIDAGDMEGLRGLGK